MHHTYVTYVNVFDQNYCVRMRRVRIAFITLTLFLCARVVCAVPARMTTSTSFCLACGLPLLPSNKRKLYSDTSAESIVVRRELREFLAEKLGQRFIEVEGEVESMMKGTLRDPGCVCKKCFLAIKAFYERKCQFLANLDAAIDKMPLCISQRSTVTGNQGRKRACNNESNSDEAVKRRRLTSDSNYSFSNNTYVTQSSPGVQVSGYCIYF